MRRWVVCATLAVMSLTACAAPTTSPSLRGSDIAGLYTLPDVELTSTAGTKQSLRPDHQQAIVFFGYSHCPDVCSGIIADLVAAKRRVAPEIARQFKVVVVTTDPARDTPKAWRAYLDRFDPDIMGLTGDLPDIVSAAHQVGVDVMRGKKLPSGGYEVDHGTQVYVFGRDFKSRVVWTTGTPIGDIKNDLEVLARQK